MVKSPMLVFLWIRYEIIKYVKVAGGISIKIIIPKYIIANGSSLHIPDINSANVGFLLIVVSTPIDIISSPIALIVMLMITPTLINL